MKLNVKTKIGLKFSNIDFPFEGARATKKIKKFDAKIFTFIEFNIGLTKKEGYKISRKEILKSLI